MHLASICTSALLGFDSPSLAPETILPEQFFRHASALSPTKRLMLAVLRDALGDLRGGDDAPTRREQRLAAEAGSWFRADDESWPFSFVSVCHALGLDASAVRRSLTRGRTEARTTGVTLRVEAHGAPRIAAERDAG